VTENIEQTNSSLSLSNKYHIVEISDNRRPVYGVLSEPLRGDMETVHEFDSELDDD